MRITIELQPQELRELLSINSFVIPAAPTTPVKASRPKPPTKEIRAWARSTGLAVAKGGTLPKDVIEAYYAHNPSAAA